MQVIRDSWTFVKEHRRKFALASMASFGVGGYVLYKQLKPVREAYKMFEQMQKMEMANGDPEIQKKQEKKRLQDRFDSNMRNGDLYLHNCVPELRKHVCKLLDVDALQKEMKKMRGKKKDEKWNSLKNMSFTRVLVALYSVVFQNVFLKIQISVASRRADFPDTTATKYDEINKKYFNFFAHYSQKIGIEKMSKTLEKIVADVLGQIQKKDFPELMTNRKLIELLKEMRVKFEVFPKEECDSETNPSIAYLIPSGKLHDDTNESSQFQQMVMETSNIIRLSSFWQTINVCLDESFNLVYELMREHSEKKRAKKNRSKNHMIGDAIRFIDYIIYMSSGGVFDSLLPPKRESIPTMKFYQQLSQEKKVIELCKVIYCPRDFCLSDEKSNDHNEPELPPLQVVESS